MMNFDLPGKRKEKGDTFRIEIRKHFLFLLIASTQNNPEARVAHLGMVHSDSYKPKQRCSLTFGELAGDD